MTDALGEELEGGDLILHIDTRHGQRTLGVYNGKQTKKGRPYFLAYYRYGSPEERIRKECASNSWALIKITEEQLRRSGYPEQVEALLELKED